MSASRKSGRWRKYVLLIWLPTAAVLSAAADLLGAPWYVSASLVASVLVVVVVALVSSARAGAARPPDASPSGVPHDESPG